jgi:hypothetical protein
MSDNNSTSSNPWGFANNVFDTFPKWLRIIFGVIMLAGAIVFAYNYFMPNSSHEESQIVKKPFIATVVGQLIERKSHKPLSKVSVSEESNPLIEDESVDNGTYILEKIKIPDSKIISLVVRYPDETKEFVKDIDLSQILPDKDGRIIIPIKEVKDFIQTKPNFIKFNKEEKAMPRYVSKDKSQQIIIPNSKGTIIIK